MAFSASHQRQQSRRRENFLGTSAWRLDEKFWRAREGGEWEGGVGVAHSLSSSQIRGCGICEEVAGAELSTQLQAPAQDCRSERQCEMCKVGLNGSENTHAAGHGHVTK